MNDTDGTGWYIRREATQYGPYPFAVLVSAAEKSVVQPDDLIFGPGLNQWTRATDVAGLFAAVHGAAAAEPDPAATRSPTDAAVETVGTHPPLDQQTSAAPARRSGNYFSRHWRGDLSLPVSYWINGILASLLSIGIVLGFVAYAESFAPNDVLRVFITLVAIVVLLLLIAVWQLVGIWRSASNHKARGGWRFWAIVAKLMVVLAALRFATDMTTTVAPMMVEYSKILAGDQKFGKPTIRLVRNGTELEFSGGINIGTGKDIEQALKTAAGITVLHLNSSGGRLAEADVIAALVKRAKLITYVSNRCVAT